MARKLSRLRDFGVTGLPSPVLTWSQRVCEQVEAANADLQAQITAIATAQAAAVAAQLTADTVKRNDAITSSYTAPGTVLTATDAGSNATISIAAHSRVYGDISNVAVNSGSITALAYSTTYFVYYDDINRVGGAVTYFADTNSNHALPNKAPGRHYVGSVLTPAAAGAPTSGGTTPPSGGGGVREADVGSTL